ncbi:MAG: hypothetical protein ACOY71_03050 [Gemmatimonadota bacterium]
MIVTIPIDHVLREAVATPYSDLVTRRTGAAVRRRIEARLAAAASRAPVPAPPLRACLDFSAVGCIDFSCADEIVAKLLLSPPGGEHYLALTGVSEAHREAIQHVLEYHGIAIAILPAGGGAPELLGAVAEDARLAWRRLHEVEPRTPRHLAHALAWPEERTRAAIGELVHRRLARLAGGEVHPVTAA